MTSAATRLCGQCPRPAVDSQAGQIGAGCTVAGAGTISSWPRALGAQRQLDGLGAALGVLGHRVTDAQLVGAARQAPTTRWRTLTTAAPSK